MRYVLLALLLAGCGTAEHRAEAPLCDRVTLNAAHLAKVPNVTECVVLEETDTSRFRLMDPQTYRRP